MADNRSYLEKTRDLELQAKYLGQALRNTSDPAQRGWINQALERNIELRREAEAQLDSKLQDLSVEFGMIQLKAKETSH
jgi:hypothetical protein